MGKSSGVILVTESLLNGLLWVVSGSHSCMLLVSVQLVCLHITSLREAASVSDWFVIDKPHAEDF